MTVLDGLLDQYWAIEPSWLPRLAALAQRDHSALAVREAQPWEKRDYEALAGPGAQKLPGASARTSVVDGVAIIPIMGPIFPRANLMTEHSGATSCTMLTNDLHAALRSGDVGAIMLLMDSPGGVATGISAFAEHVAAATIQKAIMTYVVGSACSAAYWIASSASEIAADRTAVVGSIGVVVAAQKQVQPDRNGYIEVEIVSSNAPNKRPDVLTEAGLTEIRSVLNGLEREFINDVAKGRKTTPGKVVIDFGRGGVKVAPAAKAVGMIDRIQTFEFTLAGLRRVAKQAIEHRKMSFAR